MAQQGIGAVQGRDLPLIFCSICRRRRVVRRVSAQKHSFGSVFYCCMFHKRNFGCPFFYWEADYEDHLKDLARRGLLAKLMGGTEEEVSSSMLNVKPEASNAFFDDSCPSGPGKVKKEVADGDEKLMLLRVICVVCVGIFVLHFLMLIVLLVK